MNTLIEPNEEQADVEALARAIQMEEPELSLVEILRQATEIYDELRHYAQGWDAAIQTQQQTACR